MNLHDVIKRPIVTEKAVSRQALGEYVFEVDPRARKPQIRRAVELCFGVQVLGVRTACVPGKRRRSMSRRGQTSMTTPWKKATVTLVAGQSLDLNEGA
jgi:large subunit ribosomal protein L23